MSDNGRPQEDDEDVELELEPVSDEASLPAAADAPAAESPAPAPAPDPGEAQHPAPEPPTPPSRLSQAREAREVAEEVAASAYRDLWWDAVRWPLRGSTFPAVLLLFLIAAALAFFDGGTPSQDQNVRATLQVTIGGGLAILVLAIYGRRIIFHATQADRPVPWGRDVDDPLPWWTVVMEFVAVCVFTQLPLALFAVSSLWVAYSEWTGRLVAAGLAVLGAAQLPLALVGWTVRGSLLASFPHRVVRMWRAEPDAARIAALTSVAFVSFLLLSFAFAAGFEPAADDHTPLRTAARLGLGTLRFLAFYAALVSFRIAGLLVHEVPEVEEALK